jgi:hypothetical protein
MDHQEKDWDSGRDAAPPRRMERNDAVSGKARGRGFALRNGACGAIGGGAGRVFNRAPPNSVNNVNNYLLTVNLNFIFYKIWIQFPHSIQVIFATAASTRL